jgi:hypothetical protein
VKKLVIIGTSLSIIPLPEDGERWITISCIDPRERDPVKKYDVVFELHDQETILNDKRDYKSITCPIIVNGTAEYWKDVNNAFHYPIDSVLKAVHLTHERYITSTIAYMLAYAIYLGEYNHITISRCHLSASEEYAHQRPCVEYLIGVAREKGITVNVDADSEILYSPYLYGYEKKPISRKKMESRYLYLYQKQSEILSNLKIEIAKLNQLLGFTKCFQDMTTNPESVTPERIQHIQHQINISDQLVRNGELDLERMLGHEMMLNHIDEMMGGRNG